MGKGGASANSNSGYLKPSLSNTPENFLFLPAKSTEQAECFIGLTSVENRACSTQIYVKGEKDSCKKNYRQPHNTLQFCSYEQISILLSRK